MSLTTKKSLGMLAVLAERLPEYRRVPCDAQLLCLRPEKTPYTICIATVMQKGLKQGAGQIICILTT